MAKTSADRAIPVPATPDHHQPPAPQRSDPLPAGDTAGKQGGSRGGPLPAKPGR